MKILGHEFQLIADDRLLLQSDDDGRMHAKTLKIIYNPRLPLSRQQETIQHEIFEAISELLELNMPHQMLTAVSEALYTVYKDNPEILEKIYK